MHIYIYIYLGKGNSQFINCPTDHIKHDNDKSNQHVQAVVFERRYQPSHRDPSNEQVAIGVRFVPELTVRSAWIVSSIDLIVPSYCLYVCVFDMLFIDMLKEPTEYRTIAGRQACLQICSPRRLPQTIIIHNSMIIICTQ